MRNIIILCFLLLQFTAIAQIERYKDALDIIVKSDEYKTYTKNQKKYYVSDELIIFSKMGKMFKKQLFENNVELTDYDIVINDTKNNLINKRLLDLNQKKCSKLKIYFTEQQNEIFFAELIKEKKGKAEYDKRKHFGISHMYMFKNNQGKIELLNVKQINYN